MTGSSRRALALALALLLAAPAWAWNGAGHRLVACIAWARLDAPTRGEVAQLLRAHPDYPHWIARSKNGADDGRSAFIEASTWPDDIRHDARFYDAGSEAPTARLPGFPDMRRQRDWHYLNRPLESAAAPLSGAIDRALDALARDLAAPATPRAQRTYALPWLIHLAGDAHQPLHAAVRRAGPDRTDDADARWRVINPFNPRKGESSLHAFWDDLPGPPWLRGARVRRACAGTTRRAAGTMAGRELADRRRQRLSAGRRRSADDQRGVS